MLTEQYTSDAICQSMGLPAFLERDLALPALRLLLKPSFDPEVCITLTGPTESARMSVIALNESFWRQPALCRLSAWREQIDVPASALADILARFDAALASDREVAGEMVCIDGMPVEACSITGAAQVKEIASRIGTMVASLPCRGSVRSVGTTS